MKIINITEKTPPKVVIPDGVYIALWGGNTIQLYIGERLFHLETETSVRGMDIKVAVDVTDGEATFKKIDN